MSMIKVIANNKTLGTMELLPEDFVVRLVPVDSSVSLFSDVVLVKNIIVVVGGSVAVGGT